MPRMPSAFPKARLAHLCAITDQILPKPADLIRISSDKIAITAKPTQATPHPYMYSTSIPNSSTRQNSHRAFGLGSTRFFCDVSTISPEDALI